MNLIDKTSSSRFSFSILPVLIFYFVTALVSLTMRANDGQALQLRESEGKMSDESAHLPIHRLVLRVGQDCTAPRLRCRAAPHASRASAPAWLSSRTVASDLGAGPYPR
jgi:hypothetical protein